MITNLESFCEAYVLALRERERSCLESLAGDLDDLQTNRVRGAVHEIRFCIDLVDEVRARRSDDG